MHFMVLISGFFTPIRYATLWHRAGLFVVSSA